MTTKSPRIAPGSCWQCRKRRLKCDLLRPSCSKCESRGLKCGYVSQPLKWIGGPAARGKLKGFHDTTAEATTTPEGPDDEHESDERKTLITCLSHRIATTSPFLPSSLVPYFQYMVLPRLQLSDGVSLDESIIMSQPALREAILALAHHHFLRAGHGETASSKCDPRRARQIALTEFRGRIECGVQTVDAAVQLFELVVMFCLLDGVVYPEEETDIAQRHLSGGKAIIKTWPSIPFQILCLGSSFQSHLLSVFATLDLFNALLSGQKPFFEPNIWLMFANTQTWWGCLPAGDRFLDLMKAFAELAVLGNICISQDREYRQTVVDRCLHPIVSHLQHSTSLETDDGIDEWNSFCSLYETSAMVYIHRALHVRPIGDGRVQSEVRKAVARSLDHPNHGMLSHCLVFPQLIIAAHCTHAQDQRIILQALEPTVAYLAFGNLSIMLKALKDMWNQKESAAGWLEMFAPLASSVFLF